MRLLIGSILIVFCSSASIAAEEASNEASSVEQKSEPAKTNLTKAEAKKLCLAEGKRGRELKKCIRSK